jgi:hypothetical protein
VVARGWKLKGWGERFCPQRVPGNFSGDELFYEQLHCSKGCMIGAFTRNSSTVELERTNLTVCKIYCNKYEFFISNKMVGQESRRTELRRRSH